MQNALLEHYQSHNWVQPVFRYKCSRYQWYP